uniref:SH3 domain-containing protein n=1 Tax=Taeniopygia guttata TaxID=59729 RepID=A0A674H629_TAEGU
MGIAGPGTHSASAAAKKSDKKCLFDDFIFVSRINVSSHNWNFMEKLTSKKLCPDDDCVYTNSLARAEEDYNASDCSLINIKKDEDCFKVSHYTPPCLKVYGEQYENYMGTVGYFPSSSVSEQHVYQEASQPVPTRVRNLQRPSWLQNYIWIFSVHSERKERFLPG